MLFITLFRVSSPGASRHPSTRGKHAPRFPRSPLAFSLLSLARLSSPAAARHPLHEGESANPANILAFFAIFFAFFAIHEGKRDGRERQRRKRALSIILPSADYLYSRIYNLLKL